MLRDPLAPEEQAPPPEAPHLEPSDDTAGPALPASGDRAHTIAAWPDEWHQSPADQACYHIAALDDAFLDTKRSLLWVDDENGAPARLVYATEKTVVDLLGRAKVSTREKTGDDKSKPCQVPGVLAATALSRRTPAAPWKVLRGLASGPYMLPAGEVVQSPGYNPGVGLWLPMAGACPIKTAGRGALRPKGFSREEGIDAIRWMLKELAEFPFANPDLDGAVALAYFLTLIARPAFKTCPMFIFDASRRRSGKDLLFKFWEIAAFGREATRITLRPDEEENEKRLATALLAGHTSVVFGDSRNIGWPMLYTIITEMDVLIRLLGSNTAVPKPPTLTLGANGNNLTAKDPDLIPRIICLRLEPKTANPENTPHEKTQTELLGYARSNRGALMAAGFNLLRGYLHRPRTPENAVKGIPEGTFDEWSALVRDPVLWYTGQDLLTTRERFAESAPVDDDMENLDFVSAWYKCAGTSKITPKMLLELANSSERWDEESRTSVTDPARAALASALKDFLGKANHTTHALTKRAGKLNGGIFTVRDGQRETTLKAQIKTIHNQQTMWLEGV